MKLINIQNGVAVIPMSLISISNGIVVPPLGSVRLIVARKDRFCSGTISGALSITLAPEDERCTFYFGICSNNWAHGSKALVICRLKNKMAAPDLLAFTRGDNSAS